MARSSTTFVKGHGGGRPKGARNRKALVAEEWAQSFLKDEDFQDAVRNILANPTHEHWQWTVTQVLAYAFGKPIERQHNTSDGTLPAPQFNIAWMSYDQFFPSPGGDSDALPVAPPQLPVAHHEGHAGGQELDGGYAPAGRED